MNKYIAIANMSRLTPTEQAEKAGKSTTHWRQIRSALILCGLVERRMASGKIAKPKAKRAKKAKRAERKAA